MTTSLASSSWMVTERCSELFRETREKFYINLLSSCPRSTVSITIIVDRKDWEFKFFSCFSLGRGGQSALRFARLRMEKRHNYVRKVAEVATQMFISNDKVTAAGLILAGSADFKTELSQSDMFDPVIIWILTFHYHYYIISCPLPEAHVSLLKSSCGSYLVLTGSFFLQRLQVKIIKMVDISYGGENGFNQAIELAAESLANVKFIQEKKLIGNNKDCRITIWLLL